MSPTRNHFFNVCVALFALYSVLSLNMSSLASYGKVNEYEQARVEARRKTQKRIAIICLSSIVLACIVVAAVVGATNHGSDGKPSKGADNSISSSVKAVCDVTLYNDTCVRSLGTVPNSSQLNAEDLFKLSIQIALKEVLKVSQSFSAGDAFNGLAIDEMTKAALETCGELLALAIDHLNQTLTYSHGILAVQAADDLRTWLSSAGTHQETCIDAIKDCNNKHQLVETVQNHLKNSTEMTSNTLAIITWLSKLLDSIKLRRLMSTTDGCNGDAPYWLSPRDRKLMESSDLRMMAHIVVAKDGSGNYNTIGAALNKVPEKSKNRTIIYVKAGAYEEIVRVEKSKWNVVMVGDGMANTTVSGGLNFIDGTPTFQTATFSVFGKGFIARDMGFRNTAGPAKHQAVALMASADQTVFYRCQMDAFQDTLYTHSQRQFYRECDVYGTVDFIFGNSAVVFQNCNILPRQPLPGQQNTITAQGKKDPNQNTGISIQNCTLWPFGNLTGVSTFMGRPWKNYSTAVFMQSYMHEFIDPKGWLPWIGDSAPDTIYYAEFENFGPGAFVKNRVKWKGLKFINKKQAGKFTVKSLIDGEKWLQGTEIKFKSGL